MADNAAGNAAEDTSTGPSLAENATEDTSKGPNLADNAAEKTSKGPSLADDAAEETSKEEPVVAPETGATASDKREQLLARLQAAASKVTDLEQLEQAIATFEKLSSDRLDRQHAVVRQIQFYFSDSNLRRDKFMRAQIESAPDGYVPIDVLLPFNRLKCMGCTTASEIVSALQASTASHGVEISPRKDALRRAGGAALPPLLGSGADQDRRTVQLRGFAAGDESVTIDAVSEICSSFGKVTFVRLLRDSTGPPMPDGQKPFLGVAEVEMESDEAAASIANSEKPLGWDGEALQARLMSDVRKEAREERARKRPAEDKGKGRGSGEEDGAKRQRQDPAAEMVATMERGLCLRFDKIAKSVSWRDIQTGLKPYGGTAYVDFRAGADEELGHAFVRMKDEEGVKAILSCSAEDEGCLSIQCWPSGYPPEEPETEKPSAETAPADENLEKDASAPKDVSAKKRKAEADDGVEQSVTIHLPVTKICGEEEEALLLKDARSQIYRESKGKKGKGKSKDSKGGKKGKDGKSKKGGKGKSGKRDRD